MTNAVALNFRATQFNVVDHHGQPWLRSPQIAEALGYKQFNRIADLYARNAAEFTDSMTAVVKLPTAGGLQDVRIFSLRGAHLLGMLARTAVAADFRRWVLDVLEQQAAPAPVASTDAYIKAAALLIDAHAFANWQAHHPGQRALVWRDANDRMRVQAVPDDASVLTVREFMLAATGQGEGPPVSTDDLMSIAIIAVSRLAGREKDLAKRHDALAARMKKGRAQ